MNEINLLIKMNLRCIISDIGSIKYLWLLKGKLKIFLIEMFRVVSSEAASGLNRFHRGDPVKCRLYIRFASKMDLG